MSDARHYHVLVNEPHRKPNRRVYIVRTLDALNREVELERLDAEKTVDFRDCSYPCLGPEPGFRPIHR